MDMQNDTNLMTVGDYRKKIIFFAIPVFIGNLFQQMYNTADSLIVGNLVGSSALAAVSSTGSIIFLVIGFFMGFSMGAGVVIGRNIGAGDKVNISKAVHTTVAMGLFFSVVISFLGVSFCTTLLRWMQTPVEVFSQASLYLRIYFAGSAGLIMYNTFVGILQASGDSRHPLYYLIFSSIVNIILDVFFIIVFHMGVDGAALATIISQFLSMSLALHRLTHTNEDIRIELKKISIDVDTMKEIITFGLPTALQACVIDLANLLIQSYINSFGALAMAGIGAYSKLEGFSFLPVTSFSMAMSTFVSQNFGAKKKERMREGIRFGLISAVICIECIGLLFYLFAPVLMKGFNPDPDVIFYGVERARICSLFYCLLGFSHVTSAVMRGVGKPMAPMVVMLVCWCAVRVIVLFTIGRIYHNIYLIFWIYPITWGLSSIAYLWYMRKLKKTGVL
ncbi:MAG: MATE family efflux transporter [Solobacterium sp.]|nr:MATE family efflux transporter [Solobacterium sp.]